MIQGQTKQSDSEGVGPDKALLEGAESEICGRVIVCTGKGDNEWKNIHYIAIKAA
jgi:hypothetical protein